jgi:hypothetical protein
MVEDLFRKFIETLPDIDALGASSSRLEQALAGPLANQIVQVIFARNDDLHEFYIHAFVVGTPPEELNLKGTAYRGQWKFAQPLRVMNQLIYHSLWERGVAVSRNPPVPTVPETLPQMSYVLRTTLSDPDYASKLYVTSKAIMQELFTKHGKRP